MSAWVLIVGVLLLVLALSLVTYAVADWYFERRYGAAEPKKPVTFRGTYRPNPHGKDRI